jgi:hypothetical protein
MTKANPFFNLVLLGAILLTVTAMDTRAQTKSPHARLVGAPVFSADEVKVGQVTDVSAADDGQIDQIRVTTASPLGIGERIITIPQPAFMIRSGKVMLPDLSAEDLQAFPTTSFESDALRAEDR